MEGFFTKKETELVSFQKGKFMSCMSCGLYRDCQSPRMQPYGNFKKGIMNIGEAPGEHEDTNGKPWQGKAGQLLQRTYKELGIDLFDDCININSVNCRPMDEEGNNRTPSGNEIMHCRQIVLKAIKQYKPKIIILLGGVPIISFLGHRWKKELGGISKWRGFQIPDQDFHAFVCPTFHPSYIDKGINPVEDLIWKQDLESAFALVDTPFPEYVDPDIKIIDDLSVLNSLSGYNSIDTETTGIKPHRNGHRIVCGAISDGEDSAYAFLLPNKRKEIKPLLGWISSDKIKKIGHNIKFEETWFVNCLFQGVENWFWDTMLAAHILDNRDGITSLAFQTYVNFGVVDYKSEMASYLQGTGGKDENAFNSIDELLESESLTEKLLRYCGSDAVNTYRLAQKQMKLILPF